MAEPVVEDWSRIKQRLLGWRLVRVGAGLVPLCAAPVLLYGWIAATSGQGLFWIGPPLGLTGLVLAGWGLRDASRMIRSPEPVRTGPYWVLVASGVLAFLGLALPGYLYA